MQMAGRAVVGDSGCSSLSESAGGGGGEDCWLRLQGRWLEEAVSGDSGLCSLLDSAGGGGSADGL